MWHCPSVFAFDSYNHLRPFYEELAFPTPETMDSFASDFQSICSWEEDPETIEENEISFQDNSPTCYPHASIFGPYSLNTSSGIFLSNPFLENKKDNSLRRSTNTQKTKFVDKPKNETKGDTHSNRDFQVSTSSCNSNLGQCEESYDDESDSFYSEDEIFVSEEMRDIHPSSEENFKLQSSKSPIMDALVFCALKGWGIKLLCDKGDDIKFQVTDLDEYYECSARICAKQHPTEDHAARVKALKRWFPNFPAQRGSGSFVIAVHKGTKKDDRPKKLHKIIERQKQLMGTLE